MAVKRKAVAKSAAALFRRSGRSKAEETEKAQVAEAPEEPEEIEEPEETEEPEEENEEEALARREAELTAARRKELKSTPVAGLRELCTGKGLDAGRKEDMVEALLGEEAGARARARAHEAKIRGALVGKKEELEGLSMPKLREMCAAMGTRGQLAKQAMVEMLLKQWQDDDGVDKALAKMDRDAREAELSSMEKAALKALCEEAGVDPAVKEVMVDRALRCEREMGRFAAPKVAEDGGEEEDGKPAQAARKSGKGADMVEALLENEASRKKERELRKQEEDAAASKWKQLRAMSVEELKGLLASKGQEPSGKKEDLVEAAFAVRAQEDAEAAKRARLRSMAPEDLKRRVVSMGLEVGKRDAMVEALLRHAAKAQEEARAYEARAGEVLEKRRGELEAQTAAELKEACASRGLKLGTGKQERIETLLQDARASGEVGKALAGMAMEARRQELLGMGDGEVRELCESLGVDVLVKELMVERLMAHEDEFGRSEPEGAPAAKRARTAKK